jgi:S-methylmethionine-dependent homocysteine/selenocysteine methylase
MTSYRSALPQLGGDLFLTEVGLETCLIFYDGIDLPCFATFPLLDDEGRKRSLHEYYRPLLGLARDHRAGFILDTLTWRANADWGAQLGYDSAALARANRQAVDFALEVARELADPRYPVVLNGSLGPRGDGYRPDVLMTASEAQRYHGAQIATLSETALDMLTAFTLNYVDEAIGIARAARTHNIPVVLSFTVETDGRLPTGDTLQSAIEAVDRATGASPAYYMINCAHPSHVARALEESGAWRERILGLRANASTKSHAELDASAEIDAGDPHDVAAGYRALRANLPRLSVLGGCCGTDYRHLEAILTAWQAAS